MDGAFPPCYSTFTWWFLGSGACYAKEKTYTEGPKKMCTHFNSIVVIYALILAYIYNVKM